MKRIPIILDTDPGVDDAVALALACASLDILDLKAVTTIGGNNYTSVTTKNALDLLSLFKTDVPVYAGENSYLEEPFGEVVAKFHGQNGLGDVQIPASNKQAEDLIASEAIYQICKENAHEIILVTVGPETNLAKAFLDHPDLKDYVKKIVVMGGGVNKGNVTPYAEANIYHDVKAASIVFSQGIPIDMIGLNVTLNCPLPLVEFEKLSEGMKKDVKEFISQMITFRAGEPMHDAIALATLIDDSFITWQNSNIEIETQDQIRKGESIVKSNTNSATRAAMNVDAEGFYRIFARVADFYK